VKENIDWVPGMIGGVIGSVIFLMFIRYAIKKKRENEHFRAQ